MKTLSHLQNEAIERFEKEFCRETGLQDFPNFGETVVKEGIKASLMADFLKTELENIVKESFKNTRVEENGKHNANCEHDNNWCVTHAEELIDDEYTEYGYNTALSDKHNKECEFLGN